MQAWKIRFWKFHNGRYRAVHRPNSSLHFPHTSGPCYPWLDRCLQKSLISLYRVNQKHANPPKHLCGARQIRPRGEVRTERHGSGGLGPREVRTERPVGRPVGSGDTCFTSGAGGWRRTADEAQAKGSLRVDFTDMQLCLSCLNSG